MSGKELDERVMLVDRVTGSVCHNDQQISMNGRYVFRLSGHQLAAPLLMDDDGNWTNRDDGYPSGLTALGAISVPSRVVAVSVRAIAGELYSANISALSSISLLLPSGCRTIELNDMDHRVGESLVHLQAGMLKPHARLRHQSESTPIGRVRRIDRRASAHLAAHSEDWGQLTTAGVRPIRVLASHVSEDVDIYENSVLVEAVEAAYRYVWARQTDAAQQQAFFDVLSESMDELGLFGWQAQERMLEMFGDAYEGYNEQTAHSVESELEHLRRQLGALKATETAKNVRPLGPAPVLTTNLLKDDHRYRTAHQLLIDLRSPAQNLVALDPGTSDNLLTDYVAFVLLVIISAMDDLGVRCQGGSVGPGKTLTFDNDCSVLWSEDHRLLLYKEEQHSFSIVPIPHVLDSEVSSSAVRDLLDSGPFETPTLVVYPGSTSRLPDGLGSELDCLPYEQVSQASPGIVPVSPIDARSVLRITRALRWVEEGTRFLDYATEIHALPSTVRASASVAAEWTTSIGLASFAVTDLATAKQLAVLRELIIPANRGHSVANDIPEDWERIEKELEREFELLRFLQRCPFCSTENATFEKREQRTFWCHCNSCGTEWGLQTCDQGHRTPVLIPAVDQRPLRGRNPSWIVEMFGGFALSSPCAGDPQQRWFVCHECRTCPAPLEVKEQCRRCVVPSG